MVLLIRKMKKAMAKHLPAVKEHIRGVVAMRIVAFLQVCRSVGICILEGGLLTPSFLGFQLTHLDMVFSPLFPCAEDGLLHHGHSGVDHVP